MKITHLRRGAFPGRYGPNGNRFAFYGQPKPLTVQEFRELVGRERAEA